MARAVGLVCLSVLCVIPGSAMCVIVWQALRGAVYEQRIDAAGVHARVGIVKCDVPWSRVSLVKGAPRYFSDRCDLYLRWSTSFGTQMSGIVRSDCGLTHDELVALLAILKDTVGARRSNLVIETLE